MLPASAVPVNVGVSSLVTLSMFDAPEIVYRMKKHHHAGLIVQSPDADRIRALLEDYSGRFAGTYLAVQPVPDKPTA